MSGRSYNGRFQTDYETFLFVQTAEVIYSMKLNHRVTDIRPYIAIAILDRRNELDPVTIVEDSSGQYLFTIDDRVLSVIEPGKSTAVVSNGYNTTVNLFYNSHDAH